MLLLAVCSLAIYAYVLTRPMPSKPAFPYVAVPLGSWLLIAVALPAAAPAHNFPMNRISPSVSHWDIMFVTHKDPDAGENRA
jgi:hypothetical protein